MKNFNVKVPQFFRKNHLLKCLLVVTTMMAVSCGDNNSNMEIPGVNGPSLNISQNKILINAEFLKIDLGREAEFLIPSFTDSKLSLSPNGQGGTNFKVELSLEEILGDVDFRDPQSLPGGRALPGVSTGSLPGISFTVPSFHNTTVYVGKNFFGIFYPVNLGLDDGIISSRFYLGKKAVGNLSLIGADDAGENAGFLLLLSINDTTKKYLKRVLKKYNKNRRH